MLSRFLHSLYDSGRPELVPEGGDLPAWIRRATEDAAEVKRAEGILREWHAEAVMELPGPALTYHPAAAVWGASFLFRAACLVCFREIDDGGVHDLLPVERMPDAHEPTAIFSADLCLRYWPDLHRMARARAEEDLLVKIMRQMAADFPLSACGMEITASPENACFHHPGLRQLLAERSLARADAAALADAGTQSFIRTKLGGYAPQLGRGLLSTFP